MAASAILLHPVTHIHICTQSDHSVIRGHVGAEAPDWKPAVRQGTLRWYHGLRSAQSKTMGMTCHMDCWKSWNSVINLVVSVNVLLIGFFCFVYTVTETFISAVVYNSLKIMRMAKGWPCKSAKTLTLTLIQFNLTINQIKSKQNGYFIIV